jgi:CheY-like chemotaxis protein
MASRVLVIEDDAANLELVAALLEEAGCDVLTAETGEAGIRLAMTERPALILMDLRLPDITGYEATRRLRSDPATAVVPVVALTAHAMQGEEARARAGGFDGYHAKPLEIHAFQETLRRFLPDVVVRQRVDSNRPQRGQGKTKGLASPG